MEKCTKLEYTIYKYSSYSANYIPENILVNNPSDQSSRWFTDANTTVQFLLLKLTSPAIVESITFGKYAKPHVSNLKQFRILGGTDDSNLSLLLSGGLKNDNQLETFQLRHTTVEGLVFPILYIKIEPLQSWGPAYNYTIWHVQLQGINEGQTVRSALYTINLRKEEDAVRILLKQLRRRRYKEAFEALSRETGVRLEGAAQARLWNALVESGDYERAEAILEEAVQDGEFDWYISWQPYTPIWNEISPSSVDEVEHVCCHEVVAEAAGACGGGVTSYNQLQGTMDVACSDRDWMDMDMAKNVVPTQNGGTGASNTRQSCDTCADICEEGGTEAPQPCRPGPRGGHQLVVDSTTGTLYLFGGWDGTSDLDDLWAYSIAAKRWSRLCAHSGLEGGPSPRSCHKMVLDPTKQRIYTLGRYLDQSHRIPDNMKNDLYVFDIATNEWSLLCADTAAMGGPSLVFDHQMCIDPDTQTIYVFGGRILPTVTDERVKYSGLYAYYCATDTWQLLLEDHEGTHAPQARVGHSMLFHPIQRKLYIFAGQRHREHLLDLWWWDVETRQCGAFAGAYAAARPPAVAGFTQRATLDPDADEIYVLSGLSKEKDKRVYNALWVFSLRRGTWTCAYRNELTSTADPQPRFAHQLVYDTTEKVHYLYGGNPGLSTQPRVRLDDLWSLRLTRPPVAEVVRRARAALREAQYRELVARAAATRSLEPAIAAVHYLRHRLHNTVDHTDPKQVEKFKRLPTALFTGVTPSDSPAPSLTPALTRRLARRKARVGYTGNGGADISRALAAVLGADDMAPEVPEPFDDAIEPEAEPSDVGDASEGEDEEVDPATELRAARIKIYDQLTQYFRPSSVPPKADIYDLIKL